MPCRVLVASLLGLIAPAFADEVAEQSNTPAGATTGHSLPGGVGSIFQSFVPSHSPISAVELRMRTGGGFPAGGRTTTLRIRAGSFDGPILGSADVTVPGPLGTGVLLPVTWTFAVPIEVDPGATHVIECIDLEPTILQWLGQGGGSTYPLGTFIGPSGIASPDIDLSFITYRPQIVQWLESEGGNGHYYEFVRLAAPGGIRWDTARADAEARMFLGASGHLASVASGAENAFLRSLRGPFDLRAWIGFTDDPAQVAGASEGNFRWTTGEPVTYTNWNGGEPSNAFGLEHYVEMFASGVWNDNRIIDLVFPVNGYLVEYEVAEAPEAPEAPVFLSPLPPLRDGTFTWAAGKMLAFDLIASDANAADVVTLSASGLPPGATVAPALPAMGNPATAFFSWTPTEADVGTYVIEFVASDGGLSDTFSMTITVVFDGDGDGLSDLWEMEGYTLDGTFVDLPAMGADPLRKDVFVEVDYMMDATHNEQPMQSGLDKVIAMFANAPVGNPDGSTGITLHVHVDDAIPWIETLGTTGAMGYDWSAFDALKMAHFEQALALSTHYCIFAHNLPDAISGLSRGNGASDFIVSLGSLPMTFNREWAEAGTFAHEAGHNLGLRHGGGDDVTKKPNYLSVMNLPFQLRGMRRNGQDGFFDYSREALPNLNEMVLDEVVGLSPSTAGLHTTYWAATQKWSGALPGSVDWNGNGVIAAGAAADLNNDFVGTVLTGWNDWANLNYTGGTLGAGVVIEQPAETPFEEELDATEAVEIKPGAPAGVTARAGVGSIRVAWNTCGLGLTYNVYRWVGAGTPAIIGSASQALFTDTAVTKGVTYKYAVTVVNGVESDLSATATATAR